MAIDSIWQSLKLMQWMIHYGDFQNSLLEADAISSLNAISQTISLFNFSSQKIENEMIQINLNSPLFMLIENILNELQQFEKKIFNKK